MHDMHYTHTHTTEARELACLQIIAHSSMGVKKLLEDDLIVTCGTEMPGNKFHHMIFFLLTNPRSFPLLYSVSRLEPTGTDYSLEIWFL